MDPLDEMLRRTSAAVSRYRVPERAVALASSSLAALPEHARRHLEVRGLLDAVLRIADAHQPCEVPCEVCEAVRNGLAVALGVVRAEVDVDLERKLA